MKSSNVKIADLKKGDHVKHYGATFEILEDARNVCDNGHGYGPTFVAKAKWISGASVSGYFGPARTDWTFQGNSLRSVQKI